MTSLININNIDITYPIAGQDNDTQGFRDNFRNIRNNLNTAAGEITALQSTSVTLQSQVYTNTSVANYLPTYTGNISASNITLSTVVQLAQLSQAQVAAINPNPGMLVYNTTYGNIQGYSTSLGRWGNITLS